MEKHANRPVITLQVADGLPSRNRLTNWPTNRLMDRPLIDTIEIDPEKKKVTITNNRELYQFIKSGAAVSLFPMYELLESLQAAIETVDPVLARAAEALAWMLHATYLYHIAEWTLGHAVSLSAHAADASTATGRLSTE